MTSGERLLTQAGPGESRPHRVSILFEFIRFSLAGVLNAAVGLGVIWGPMVSLSQNKNFTFGSKRRWHLVIPRFLLVTLVAYLVNLMVVMVSVDLFMVDPYVAQLLGMPFYTLIGFFGYRHFVFGGKR
jgi:putative flippase GtrA